MIRIGIVGTNWITERLLEAAKCDGELETIVQDIISRHHGMIDVSSKQAQGFSGSFKSHYQHNQTRFTLYLPFSQPSADR